MVPSGLDEEQLLIQVARLEESLQKIERYSHQKLDETIRAALERHVHLAVEECLNIGNHLISGLGLPRADTYKDIFNVLEEKKVIPPVMSQELQRFAVFRNRLVHLYWKITDTEFREQVAKIEVLRAFVKAVMKQVKSHTS